MVRGIFGAAVLALSLSVPSIASADTTIGSTTQPSGSTANNAPLGNGTFVQTGSASFRVAVPPGGGSITSWSTNTVGATAGATVKLVVLRPVDATTYTVIAVDTETLPTPLPATGVATFNLAEPIAVNAGDTIGINASTNAVVLWDGGTTPATDTVAVVSSTPTPLPPAPGQTVQIFGSGEASARINLSAVVNTSFDAGVTTSTAPAMPRVGTLAVLGSTVTNNSRNGGSIAFTDVVPSGLSIKSAVAGSGSCNVSGQTVTCAIGDLPGDGSVPVNILVSPNAAGSYVNQVAVASTSGSDPNPTNNAATAMLNVRAASPGASACIVPRLRGTPARVAKRVLKQLGCKVQVKRKRGKGVPHRAVLKTKPGPGNYSLGRQITLIVRK